MKNLTPELEFTFSRSSGAGGQNINKVNSKATLIWDIYKSKLISMAHRKRFLTRFSQYMTSENIFKIHSQKYRTQSRNIADCTQKLISMLSAVEKPPKRRIATKPTKGSVERRIEGKKSKSTIKKNRQKVKFS